MATKSKTSMSKRLMNNDTRSGFTIIEVVLVLAIGGLIFMMVFLAFPQLQRSQRDSQRQRDMGKLATAVLDYQGNNNGKLPGMDSTGKLNAVSKVDATTDLAVPDCSTATSRGAGAAACLINRYLNAVDATENEWVDPDGWAYGLTIQNIPDATFEVDADDYKNKMVYLLYGANCDGEAAVKSNNPRDFVVMYKMEGSGSYCR